jgi:hypothetical protein
MDVAVSNAVMATAFHRMETASQPASLHENRPGCYLANS